MQTVSDLFKSKIKEASREFESKITIGENIYTNEDLVDIKISNGIPGDGFMIGATPSATLDLTLLNRGDTIYSTNQIKIEIGLNIGSKFEYLLMGRFNIDEVEKTDYTVKFTAYDNMIKFETAYFSSLGASPTLQQVVNELASKTGVQFTGTLPAYNVKKLEGVTCREVLGYVASLCGGNALITRDGKFTIVTPKEVGYTITPDNYIPPFNLEEVKYKVGKVSCQVGEEVLSKGSLGTDSMELQFENPWITATILTDIYNKLNGFNYLGYSLKWQGDISLDIGDIVSVTDIRGVVRKLPILNQELNYIGGLTSTISAKGETKNKNSFNSSGSMSNKINRLVTEQAIIKEAIIEKANIEDLKAINAEIANLKVKDAEIEDALIKKATIEQLNAANANIQNLIAEDARINNLVASKASITELNAVSAKIGTVEADTAIIKDLLAGNVTAGSGQIIHLTAKNVTIEDAVIKNLIAAKLSVADLQAGTISTNKFSISSTDGGLNIVGPTIQWKDKNNKIRMQAGKDAQGNFTFLLVGEDGTTALLDQTGIKKGAIANDLIVSDMISENAIGEKQINYSSLITGLNKDDNTSLIKASKVAIDLTGQSLEVAFNSLKSNVDNMEIGGRNLLLDSLKQVSNSEYCTAVYKFGNERLKEGEEVTIQIKGVLGDGKTNWRIFNSGGSIGLGFMGDKGSDGVYRHTIKWRVGSSSNTALYVCAVPDTVSAVSSIEWVKLEKGNKATDWTPAPEDIDQVTQNLQTQITANLKGIEALIKDTTITEGSTGTSLKDAYISLKATVNGLNSTVASHTSSISTVTTELGKVDGKINTAKSDAISTAGADATSKSNKAKTDAIAAASTDATSKANNALNSAKSYTNAQITTVNTRVSNAESSINQLKDSITQKVWQTDIDKTVSEVNIGGRNLLLDSLKQVSNSEYCTAVYKFGNERLKEGEEVTIQIKGVLGDGKTNWRIFNSGGSIGLGFMGDKGSDGVYRHTIKWRVGSSSNTALYVCAVPDTVSAVSSIEWVKLEKGNKATDWTPAPEDVDESILAVSKEVTTVKEKAASLETSLNSITSKVTNLESTTSTINGKVNAQETRLQSTEQKVTATGVITTIQEAINKGTNSLTTMQFILDKNGTTIKNGSLKILNNAGESVLHGDTTGNLIIRGVFEQFQGGIKSVDIRNNAVNLYDWSRDGDLVGGMIAVVGNADGRGKAMLYADQGNPLLIGYCDANRENYYGVVVIDDTKQANGNQTVVGLYDHMAFFDYQALHFYGLDHTIPLGKITVADSNNTLNILGKQNYSSVRIGEMTTSANSYQSFAKFDINGLYIWGNIGCSGSKTRIVPTKNYDGVKLNAYETADCYFGDIGEGTIGEDGLCYVYIDPLLLETINTKCTYQVFVQPYGDGKAYQIERKETFFVIKGTPGLKFGWEFKAKQRGYETERLEREKLELSEQDSGESFLDYIDKEPDYDDFAIKYLKYYEKELIENG